MNQSVAVQNGQSPRELALLKAVGLDRAQPEQRELAVNIAERYELDLLMKHLVLIDGRPYITRDGLLHVAHRSGKLDGITTSEPAIIDGFWRATCSVYRNDMSHPFTYTGRYPTSGGNQKFAPEMAVKVAEVMALRRAFDVAAPTAEERWDATVPDAPAEQPKSLAERAAEKAAAVPIIVEPGETVPSAAADVSSAEPPAETSAPTPQNGPGAAPDGKCGNASPFGDGGACGLPAGHAGKLHRQLDVQGTVTGSWPTT